MLMTVSLPLGRETLRDYGGWEKLRSELIACGCDGVEGIWCGEDIPEDIPRGLVRGYHLTFFPDWLDCYRYDKKALLRKYGSLTEAAGFYGGLGPEPLLSLYRADLERAARLGVEYVVFHVSDNSIEESYTYRWLHSDQEVISAATEILNTLLPSTEGPFELLLENQWWAGFRFTEPQMTAALLEGVSYRRKGIMLDLGHLMNTDPAIDSEASGIRYIREMLERHGRPEIRGVHLHQSVSGAYVRAHTGVEPPPLPAAAAARFAASYAHIQSIDRHQPWTDKAVAELIGEIAPAYLTHELAAADRHARAAALQQQLRAMGRR